MDLGQTLVSRLGELLAALTLTYNTYLINPILFFPCIGHAAYALRKFGKIVYKPRLIVGEITVYVQLLGLLITTFLCGCKASDTLLIMRLIFLILQPHFQ